MLNLINHLKKQIVFQVFTVYLRYLIGGAFVIAAFGMGKVNGNVNLLQSADNPIEQLQPMQQFFRVMSDSGLYWMFIGWSQIITGALLMTQRLARLGALLFFGLALNIFMITISYGFQGTPIVTGLMLLAAIYLLIWDLSAFMPIINQSFIHKPVSLALADHPFWIILGFVIFLSIIILALVYHNMLLQLGVPFIEGLLGFILFMIWRKKKRKKIEVELSK